MIVLDFNEGCRVLVSEVRRYLKKYSLTAEAVVIFSGGEYDTNKKLINQLLLKVFSAVGVVIIHIKDYRRERADGCHAENEDSHAKEDPADINWKRAARDIARLKRGERITKPKYYPEQGVLRGVETVQGKIVVVWGALALHSSLSTLADIKIYSESDKITRLARSILSDLKKYPINTILERMLTGHHTGKNFVEPTRTNANYVIVNNEQPSFKALKAVKLFDCYPWEVMLGRKKLSVLGEVNENHTRFFPELYIFPVSGMPVIRVRKKSIGFLTKANAQEESWLEIDVSPDLCKKLLEQYGPDGILVSRLRTMYEIEGRGIRFYVDTKIEILRNGHVTHLPDRSALIRRNKRKVTDNEVRDIINILGLTQLPLISTYSKMKI